MILSRRPLNLVLVHQPTVLEIEDLRIIAAEVKKLAPDIHVSIAEPWMWAGKPTDAYWQRPTVTVSFGDTGRFAPIRGPIFMNQPIAKIDQYERLTAAGVATPKTAKYEIGMGLSEEDWGPLVILKPAPLHMTSSGRALYLFRTRSLDGRGRDAFPRGHAARRVPMLVQRFVDTGIKFRIYRCLTLFGETMYQSVGEAPHEHPSLDSDDDTIEGLLPEPPRHETQQRISHDAEVTAFAREMAGAFPRIPILGCDIIREAATGQLFAIEVNAGGNVWHISSPRTKQWRTLDGTMHLVRAFDTFQRAAHVLVEITRKHAA